MNRKQRARARHRTGTICLKFDNNIYNGFKVQIIHAAIAENGCKEVITTFCINFPRLIGFRLNCQVV